MIDLLVEIGTEELPPKALYSLSDAFGSGIYNALVNYEINADAYEIFATPRRLAVWIKSVAAKRCV